MGSGQENSLTLRFSPSLEEAIVVSFSVGEFSLRLA